MIRFLGKFMAIMSFGLKISDDMIGFLYKTNYK